MSEMLFVVIWQFDVRAGAEGRFLEAYGPAGPWAKLFARDPNYVRTELQRDLRRPGRYLTLDYWRSESAYEQFRDSRRHDYEAIDRECEELTEAESLVGRYEVVG